MNRVETFSADTVAALQTVINAWCKAKQLNPISISIMRDDVESHCNFAAAVVVEDLYND